MAVAGGDHGAPRVGTYIGTKCWVTAYEYCRTSRMMGLSAGRAGLADADPKGAVVDCFSLRVNLATKISAVI